MEVTSALWQPLILVFLYVTTIYGQIHTASADSVLDAAYGRPEVNGASPAILGIPRNGMVLPNFGSNSYVDQQPYNSIPWPSLSFRYSPVRQFPGFPLVKSVVSAIKNLGLFLLSSLKLSNADRYNRLRQAADNINTVVDTVENYIKNAVQMAQHTYDNLLNVPLLGIFVQLGGKLLYLLSYIPMALLSSVTSASKTLVDGLHPRYGVPGVTPFYG